MGQAQLAQPVQKPAAGGNHKYKICTVNGITVLGAQGWMSNAGGGEVSIERAQ